MLPKVTTILFKRGMNYEQFACFNLKSNVSMSNDYVKQYVIAFLGDCIKMPLLTYSKYSTADLLHVMT